MASLRTWSSVRTVAFSLIFVSVVALLALTAVAFWLLESDSDPLCSEVRDQWEAALDAVAADLRVAGASRVYGPKANSSECALLQVVAEFDEPALPLSIGTMTYTSDDLAHDRRGCGRTLDGATVEAVALGGGYTVVVSGTTYELPCTVG